MEVFSKSLSLLKKRLSLKSSSKLVDEAFKIELITSIGSNRVASTAMVMAKGRKSMDV